MYFSLGLIYWSPLLCTLLIQFFASSRCALCIVQAYLVELKWHWLYQGILKSNKDNNITIVYSVFQFFCVKIMCLISIKKMIIASENKVFMWLALFKKAEATIWCVSFSKNFITTRNKYCSKTKCFISFNNYSKI